MSYHPADLAAFLVGALLPALLAGGLVLAVLRLLRPQLPAQRVAPALLAWLFFVCLTIFPLPDPATLSCPVPSAAPQLQPFAWWRIVRRLLTEGGTSGLGTLAGAGMNLMLCALPAALAARAGMPLRWVIGLGAATTLAVETAQLTGFWGLSPCAWRRFDVDDLILNFAGATLGALLGRRLRPQARP